MNINIGYIKLINETLIMNITEAWLTVKERRRVDKGEDVPRDQVAQNKHLSGAALQQHIMDTL